MILFSAFFLNRPTDRHLDIYEPERAMGNEIFYGISL